MATTGTLTKSSKTSLETILPNKKVYLVPIPRNNAILSESGIGEVKKHAGYIMWEGAERVYRLPVSAKTGTLVRIFSDNEEAYLSKKMNGVNLSIYNKVDNFWHTFKVRIRKEDLVDRYGNETRRIFDLSDPMQFIAYRVCLANADFAPDWDSRHKRGEYMFTFIEAGYEDKEELEKADKLMVAYNYFAEISENRSKMINFINVYWLYNDRYVKSFDDSVSTDFLKAEIQRLIGRDLNLIYRIVKDPNIGYIYDIYYACSIGAIKRYIKNNSFELPNGTPIGVGIDEVVRYFKDLKNNEEWLRIKANIDLHNEKVKE